MSCDTSFLENTIIFFAQWDRLCFMLLIILFVLFLTGIAHESAYVSAVLSQTVLNILNFRHTLFITRSSTVSFTKFILVITGHTDVVKWCLVKNGFWINLWFFQNANIFSVKRDSNCICHLYSLIFAFFQLLFQIILNYKLTFLALKKQDLQFYINNLLFLSHFSL